MTAVGRMVAGVVLLTAGSIPIRASISVRRAPGSPRLIDVAVIDERLSDAVAEVARYLTQPVQSLPAANPRITYRAVGVSGEAALRGLAEAARFEVARSAGGYELWDRAEPRVTLDVKDAEARLILQSMQRQCGIKNLLIDAQVQGTGTFLLRDVPCRQAFTVVLRSLGLAAQSYSNQMIQVGEASH